MDHEKAKIFDLSVLLSLLFLAIFVTLALSLTFSKGICCGDDAYFAVVAKNLANGLGYSSSFFGSTSYTLQPFDTGISAGPTIILPASVVIKLFGNTYWAPGLTNVILWSLTLVAVGVYIKKYLNGPRYKFALFTFSFLFLCISLMSYHYEHWYALLGEIPAALFLLLGVLIFLDSDARHNQVVAGLLFSFAVQAKLLALVGVLVFMFVQLFVWPRGPRETLTIFTKKIIARLFYTGIGFLLPIVSFELWKLVVLGIDGYIENWRTNINWIISQGSETTSPATLSLLFEERLETLWGRFGISLLGTCVLLIFDWLLLRKDKKLCELFCVFCSIIAVYSFWWFFISNGWARYLIICLIILILVLLLPLLAERPKSQYILYLLMIIFFSSANWTKLSYSFTELRGEKLFSPTDQTAALLKEAQYLSNLRTSTDNRIVTIVWSTAADLEYIMPDSMNFTSIWDEELSKQDDFVLALNTNFIDTNTVEELLSECKILSDTEDYLIVNCELSP